MMDEYDVLLREAEADSKDRFLRLLGPIRQYIERPDVFNVNINEGDEGRIFVESASGKFEAPQTMPRADREALIGNIAGKMYATVDRLHARLACGMPHGFDVRVQAFCPPISDWPIMLRRHSSQVFDLRRQFPIEYDPGRVAGKPVCSARGYDAIAAALGRGEMIGFVGEPGSGKSSCMNAGLAIAEELRPKARLVLVQDVPELKPSHGDHIKLFASLEQKHYDGTSYEYDHRMALADALRTGFNILVNGEIRSGPAAVAMVEGFNTGSRGGLCTWHASTALGGLSKLEYLLRLGGVSVPLDVLRQLIVNAIDMLIVMRLVDGQRHVIGDIVRVMGVNADGQYVLESVA